MKKNFAMAGRCLAWLTAFNIALSSVSGIPVYAEEISDEPMELIEEEAPVSSVFVVTAFPDFAKNDSGEFSKEEIRNKYGNIQKEEGTSFDMLELPSSLKIEGHWEGGSADASESYMLEGITWTLKSDSGETYSEASPAGIYTFIPDLNEYLYMQDAYAETYFDDLPLAENTKLPAITVEIIAPQTEAVPETTETQTAAPETDVIEETDYISDADSFYETDYIPEAEFVPETDYVPESESVSDIDYVPESESVSDTDYLPESDFNEETVSPDEDIFSNIDDSILVTDLSESTLSEPESTDSEQSEPVSTEPETVPEETNGDVPIMLSETDETEPQASGSGNESDSGTDDTDPTEREDLTVTISVSDGQTSYNYIDEDTNNTVALLADDGEVVNEASLLLPCDSELNMQSIAVTFMNADRTQTYSFIPGSENYQDFRAEATKTFTCYPDPEDDTLSYILSLTVKKSEHAWGAAATCTTPQICTVCGIENPDAPSTGHKLSEATCTKPATCSVCGWTDGVLMPHTWVDATCTTPKTCSVCAATSGKKLGHDLGGWETVTASTDSEHGEAIRYCYRENCDYSESKPLNIIGDPANNTITDLVAGQTYNLKETLTFHAVGAGMRNSRPINGDVRYVPSSWKIQNTPGSFRDNYSGSFAITIAGTYTLTVTFQKQIFNDGWQVTEIADSKSITFNVGTMVQGTPVNGAENGIRINPQTNDPTVIIGFVIAIAAAAVILIIAVIYKKRKRR